MYAGWNRSADARLIGICFGSTAFFNVAGGTAAFFIPVRGVLFVVPPLGGGMIRN